MNASPKSRATKSSAKAPRKGGKPGARAQYARPPSSRKAALALLTAILRKGRLLDEALDSALAGLEPRDRALARAIAATTLRRLGQIDDAIGRCLNKPIPEKLAHVQDSLRLGAAQILFLKLSPHAAVNETVSLLPPKDRFRGLVNAVLRRLDREGDEILKDQDAARLNTPDWLWDGWARAYSEETARAIAAAHLTEAPLDITVKADPEHWADLLEAVILPTGSLRRPAGGAVEQLPGFKEGAWWVQDAAAALPARLLDPKPGQTAIDLCAAPGGKTAQLALAGAEVTAVDRSRKRLDRLARNLERLGLAAATVAADGAEFTPDAPVDLVLLDAPCSSTGTIHRHPDVARLKTYEDVDKLAEVQERLLHAAIDMVKPGGLLVYSVCSLQREEGEEQIEALLASGAPVERLPIRADEVGGLEELITEEGDLRCLPCHLAELGGLDGFFACRLRRL